MTEDPWGLDGLEVPEDEFVFNGIDAATGSYLFPRTRLDRVASAAQGMEQQDPAHLGDLEARKRADTRIASPLSSAGGPSGLTRSAGHSSLPTT